MMSNDDETFYTTEDVARILKMSIRTVREYIQKGELVALDMGREYRISKRDLDAFIESRRRKRPRPPDHD